MVTDGTPVTTVKDDLLSFEELAEFLRSHGFFGLDTSVPNWVVVDH
jgi:hypothetical protein